MSISTEMEVLDEADRRNGAYARHLLTELGDIELAVRRTRRLAPIGVMRAYAPASSEVDRMILSCFVSGFRVRKVGEALLPMLGRPISPATVSQVAKQLDAVVAAFHARPLKDRYRVLMLDGVVIARSTGAGAIRRPVLVSSACRPDGKKEIIDFRLAQSESAAEWERFLGDLIRRGLVGDTLEMICVDGGSGLLAALPTAYPGVRVQRCWAHKIRNVLDKVRVAHQPAVKADLHRVMNAKTIPQARSAARRLAQRQASRVAAVSEETMTGEARPHPTVAEALLRHLAELGIDHVFANAGTDFPPIVEALCQAYERGEAVPTPSLYRTRTSPLPWRAVIISSQAARKR